MIEYFSLTGLLIEPERHIILCASGSVVEYRLAKARVAGSNPVSRSEEPDSLSGFLLYTDIEDLERWGKDD